MCSTIVVGSSGMLKEVRNFQSDESLTWHPFRKLGSEFPMCALGAASSEVAVATLTKRVLKINFEASCVGSVNNF